MIVVTGAAGFIGSALLSKLMSEGYGDLVAVDDLNFAAKQQNLRDKRIRELVSIHDFPEWLRKNGRDVQFVHHIGARTDTAEFDRDLLQRLNTEYTKTLWRLCCEFQIPFIYASSAATYGAGEHGFSDNFNELNPELLQPLNEYGRSKHEFDLWALKQEQEPMFWAGFKFFNVFGPNEYHKSRMASVVFHAYHQIMDTGKVRLFRSHRSDYKDGWQLRDFIYVKDVTSVLIHFMENRKHSGLYNLGTGIPRSFYDLATSTFSALNREPIIEYIDIPEDIRDKYQYYTCAKMEKLRNAGYTLPFTALEDAVAEYVTHYLPDRIL